jgi:hypothetical protein
LRLLDWRRVLVYTHRWLGIAGSLIFITWFLSGVVMMYARLPTLTLEERLARQAPLDLTTATIGPSDAATRAGLAPDAVRVAMLGGRPAYRLTEGQSFTTLFADSGESFTGWSHEGALRTARRFVPEHASTMRYDSRIADADQWTFAVRRLMPMHRVVVGDADGTVLYISDLTGQPEMKSTREQRVWGYLGAVLHWIYFTPLRRHSPLWNGVIVWGSIAGCLLCLSGLVWGLWRYSVRGIYRLKRIPSHTPYAGWMAWHHYTGLIFGLVTFTWILSGLLSMVPFDWSPGAGPTREQRLAVSGGPLRIELATLERLRAATAALSTAFRPAEVELLQVGGEPVLRAYRAGGLEGERWNSAYFDVRPLPDQRLVSLASPGRGLFRRFTDDAMLAAGRRAVPRAHATEAVWLHAYDSYYYDRHGSRPLPVLRMQFDDDEGTLLYLDPSRGEVVLNHGRRSRLERWLYNGLHSLDFPGLYDRRPLWDVVVVALSVGGLVLSATTVLPALRRFRRHFRRLAALVAPAPPPAKPASWLENRRAPGRSGSGAGDQV